MPKCTLTKAQAKQYAEGFNLKATLHSEGKSDGGKSPRGAWVKLGYEEARTIVLDRQLTKGATEADIMAPIGLITAESAQAVYDAADVRLDAKMAAFKARVN